MSNVNTSPVANIGVEFHERRNNQRDDTYWTVELRAESILKRRLQNEYG